MSEEIQNNQGYGADQIQILEGLEGRCQGIPMVKRR